jgi:intracellular sulfur oxidation DsrE/DsrF family protein
VNADFELKRVGSAFARSHLHDLARMVAVENTAVTVERYGEPCVVMLGPAHLEALREFQERKSFRTIFRASEKRGVNAVLCGRSCARTAATEDRIYCGRRLPIAGRT